MGEIKWTKEQLLAIEEKNSNILVAAAAGSGKTAVLVERIIQKVINEKIDLDKLLVVTFTNAAASEMRERILEALYKKLEEFPSDKILQRQIILLPKANICTIDAFCLNVIKNNFYDIGISPNFRIGNKAETEILKKETLEEVFENKYIEGNIRFKNLVNIYTSYKDDTPLKELILKIYKDIQSNPFPEDWLNEKVEMFNLKDKLEENFEKTVWGEILFNNIKEEIKNKILIYENLIDSIVNDKEHEKIINTLKEDLTIIKNIYELDTWDEMYEKVKECSKLFSRWPSIRNPDIKEEIESIKKIRTDSTEYFKKTLLEKSFFVNSKEALEDIYSMYDILKSLCEIVNDFSKLYATKKREKNMLDFNDMEHFALNILLKKDENGIYVSTNVAKHYQAKFQEIAIDEYQDSNLVQEYILTSVSKGNNIFMVGDIKQSIYKFRKARPELFKNKYETYKIKEEKEENDDLKIQLFKNFRSRKNILDVTNVIFENIMSKRLGDIDYDENEYLNLGANYPEPNLEEIPNIDYAGKTQLDIIDCSEIKDEENNIDENKASKEKKSNNIEDKEDFNRIEDIEVQAKFVANKIEELVNSNYMVYDKKLEKYRKIKYRDIVILLRSTKNKSNIFEHELNLLDIPVFTENNDQYLESIEIQTIMSLLKVIDNPMQDIPLVTVLRSVIGSFNDNELIEIRIANKDKSFYEAMIAYTLKSYETEKENKLKNKIQKFIESIDNWRKEEEYLSLDELIWQIYLDTGYYNYVSLMKNGNLRQANLKILFERAKQYESASYKGLFNFINFIDQLIDSESSGDMGSAKLIGENDDVVRIMSIHKSKGLEFPVVFLCNVEKKPNKKDLNDNILLDQDLGFGPRYINYERKIKYDTLAKSALASKTLDEMLSEEMRVLYVALTRAKEKLYIVASTKDSQKQLEEMEKMVKIYKRDINNFKIDKYLLKKYCSYLEWIELVYFNNKINTKNIYDKQKVNDINDIITININKKIDILNKAILDNNDEEDIIDKIRTIGKFRQEILNASSKEEIQDIEKRFKELKLDNLENDLLDIQDVNEIKQLLEWKYKYILATKIPTKSSVTRIKQMQENEDSKKIKPISGVQGSLFENLDDIGNIIDTYVYGTDEDLKLPDISDKIENNFVVPNFLKEYITITPAKRGTLMHLCLQLLDQNVIYTKEMIIDLVNSLVKKNIISQKEADSIYIDKLYNYTKSNLFSKLKNAKQVCKERPFYMNIPAKEIYKDKEEAKDLDEKILVQGIIDLYYIDENDKLILVDYKTDRVYKNDEYRLIEKYKKQLELYKTALEESLQRKVDEVYIYSIYLDKEINMNNIEKNKQNKKQRNRKTLQKK